MTKNLNLALPWIRSSSKCTTDGRCSALGLAATPRLQNLPDRKGRGKNIPIQTKFTGVPRELFLFTKEVREKHGSLFRGPETVRKQRSDVSL